MLRCHTLHCMDCAHQVLGRVEPEAQQALMCPYKQVSEVEGWMQHLIWVAPYNTCTRSTSHGTYSARKDTWLGVLPTRVT